MITYKDHVHTGVMTLPPHARRRRVRLRALLLVAAVAGAGLAAGAALTPGDGGERVAAVGPYSYQP